MPYCPKCGSSVDEKMTFCPDCGTQLKNTVINQGISAEQPQKAEEDKQKQSSQQSVKAEKKEAAERGFVYNLAAGLILVTVGVIAILELTNHALSPSGYLTVMLVIIGVIVIVAAIYVATAGWKHFPGSHQKN